MGHIDLLTNDAAVGDMRTLPAPRNQQFTEEARMAFNSIVTPSTRESKSTIGQGKGKLPLAAHLPAVQFLDVGQV